MKKNLLRIGCSIFAIITVLSCFVACGKTESSNNTNNGNISTEEVEQAPVPHYDWKGRVFSVLSVQNAYEPNFEIVGEYTGTRVEPTVFERNLWIKEYYNVEIQQYGDDTTKNIDVLKNTISAGDYDYDLAFLVRNEMANAITSGYMTDITGIEYIDLSHDWYNPTTIDSMKIGGRLFHMVSDFSLVDKARTNVLFFNREMAEINQLPDVLALVRNGNWTIEQMLLCAKSADLDGDGDYDLNDQWGLACGGKEGSVAFWNGLGNKLVNVDKNGGWTVDVANEHSVNSVAELRKLFSSDVSFVGNKFGSYDDGYDCFIESRCLFLGGTLSTVESVGADATFSFTALPFPKYDADQTQYYTTNDNTYCATYGVPVCAYDPDFSGFMIEVLSWKSHTTTFPEYYEIVCKVKKSYDETCAEMLDLIFKGLVFDFGLMYPVNIKTGVLIESILNNKDITGLYQGVESATETKIQNIFNAVEALD